MSKNCDCTIEYHPRKANVVVNALSRKFKHPEASLNAINSSLLWGLKSSNAVILMGRMGDLFAHF